MTPPTAPERCQTCDRERCLAIANAMTTEERKAYARLLDASELGQRIDADTRATIEAAANRGAEALADCRAHRVDWRARAIAAEAELAGASAAICDVSDTIRRALDGDEGGMRAPYHGPLAVVLRYPSIAADLRRLDEVLTIGSPRAAAMRDAAAKWAAVAPLIERLRAECGEPPFRGRVPSLIECAAAILAAAEATP